ncbi:MAG: HlyC/CorC family transporter [Acidobacteria bacterium]|nr:HlyC/CorC family transporter [Acidobacteriota bacterium]
MESEIVVASILIMVLVVASTAKSALGELSDVSLRLLASETEESPHAEFWKSILERRRLLSFTLTFGIHFSIATIAILMSSIALRIYPQHFLLSAFGGMILTVIVFRQVLPLVITQNDPARTLLRLRIPLKVLWRVLGSIAHPLYHSLRGLQREPGIETEKDEEGDSASDEIELQAFLDVGEEQGIIEQNEGEMIQSIIRFSDRTVDEVMTTRTNIVAVEAETPLDQVRDLMIESKYSRLPVYRGDIDDIEGIIFVRDLLKYWQNGETNRKAIEIVRPTYFIPETKAIDALLPEMQKAKNPMAIVINEYGGISGLVTIEDLIEEIVGEIEDEDEPEPQETETEMLEVGVNACIVRGIVEVGKIERRFDVELAADDFTTVAGLVINQLGHLPSVGETLDFRSLRFHVIEADERRVSRIRIERVTQDQDQAIDQGTAETSANQRNIKNGK